MKEIQGKGWKHPGKSSSDYGVSDFNDHDRRVYGGSKSHAGKGPKGYRRSNESIREDVCELLYRDPDVDATDISVEVHDNFVFLEGSVDSRHSKRHAERLIETVRGVVDIFNRLKIKPLLDIESDKIITRGDEGLFSQETIPH